MKNSCFWQDKEHVPSAPLVGHEQAEFLIVGGGITGLCAAYFLLEAGVKDIVLIEKNTIGSGSTGHSAGMLVAEIETGSWPAIAERFGEKQAALYWHAQRDMQRLVGKIVREGNIECGYCEEEFIYLARNKKEFKELSLEVPLRVAMGANVALLEGAVAQSEISFKQYPAQARVDMSVSVNPLCFSRGFAHYLKSRGVRIYEHTKLLNASSGHAKTQRGIVAYGRIIYAVGTSETSEEVHNLLTTICVTRPLSHSELEAVKLVDKDMFLNLGKRSYHYGKVTEDHRLLVGYGDTKYENSNELHVPHVRSIEHFILQLLGPDVSIDYAWSAPYALSRELLPFVSVEGHMARVGGAGTQMASGVAAGYAVAKLLGKKHQLEPLFAV